MSKIAVIGNEDFTIGFELVGVDAFSKKQFEEIFKKKDTYSLIIIEENFYKSLSIKLKNEVDMQVKPIVVILSEKNIRSSNLKNQIIKSLGIDLLK